VNPITNQIYVSGGNKVSVINGNTNAVISAVEVFGCIRVAVNVRTNRVYATSFATQTVSVIDGTSNALLNAIPVPFPHAVAVNPVTNRIYVAGESDLPLSSPPITIIDGKTDSVMGTIPIEVRSRGLAVDALTNRLYVVNVFGELLAIDGRTNAVLYRVPLAGPTAYGVAVDQFKGRVYVSTNPGPFAVNYPTGYVFVINGRSGQIIEAVPVRNVNHPAIDVLPTRDRFYVGSIFGIVSSVQDNFRGVTKLPNLGIGTPALASAIERETEFDMPIVVANAQGEEIGIASDVKVRLITRNLGAVNVTAHQAICESASQSDGLTIVQCTIQRLRPGQRTQFSLAAKVLGPVLVRASVTAAELDTDPQDNQFRFASTASQ
jgi:hypothetical protein